jgi:hypothetical protein
MGSGLEGRPCMLGGLATGRGGIAGEGRVRTRTCILGPDVQEFVERGLLGPDLEIGRRPLSRDGDMFVCYDGRDEMNQYSGTYAPGHARSGPLSEHKSTLDGVKQS